MTCDDESVKPKNETSVYAPDSTTAVASSNLSFRRRGELVDVPAIFWLVQEKPGMHPVGQLSLVRSSLEAMQMEGIDR